MPAQNVQSIGGVIYLSVSFLGMANMMAVMPLVALERTVYYREQAASYYNPWAYGIAISLIEIPYQLVQVSSKGHMPWRDEQGHTLQVSSCAIFAPAIFHVYAEDWSRSRLRMTSCMERTWQSEN